MKNIDKYPNTANALEAYAAHRKAEGLPFEEWLTREYVAPREPTLLEAAEAVVNDYLSATTPLWKSQEVVKDLADAVERERNKPVRNLDVYKTAEEAYKVFDKSCDCMCHKCKFAEEKYDCFALWLYAEAGKEAK